MTASPDPAHDRMMQACADLALTAGEKILDVRRQGPHVRFKNDQSPVCEADERAEAVILEGLSRLYPEIPVVAEEAFTLKPKGCAARRFFLVDALDGTKDFISGRDGFTVNIALIEDGAPCIGVVFAPAADELWLASAHAFHVRVGAGAQLPDRAVWQALAVRKRPGEGLTALSSRSHGDERSDALLAALPVAASLRSSSSLKFCRIAEGKADIYPRFSPIMEWDTAAGDAVLRAAGGCVFEQNGLPLVYGRAERGHANPGFVAVGDPALREDVLQILSQLA